MRGQLEAGRLPVGRGDALRRFVPRQPRQLRAPLFHQLPRQHRQAQHGEDLVGQFLVVPEVHLQAVPQHLAHAGLP
jgi:hypothetical protein